MAESTTPVKKAPTKKSVAIKRSAPKKITLKKDLDEGSNFSRTTQKKPVKAKPVVKKSAKKTDKRVVKNNSDTTTGSRPTAKNTRSKNDIQDENINKMIHQISESFSAFAEQSNKREERSLEILNALTESLKKDHDINQQETFRDKRQNNDIQQMSRSNRIILIPTAVIAGLGIIATLYVVNMLGTAMTNISTDIHKIQQSVEQVSTRMDSMTMDISSMSGNIQQLNRNVTTMSKDLSVLSYTVAPAMQGMRSGMPWAPQ